MHQESGQDPALVWQGEILFVFLWSDHDLTDTMIVCPDPTPDPASVEDQTALQWQDPAALSVSTDQEVSPDYQGEILVTSDYHILISLLQILQWDSDNNEVLSLSSVAIIIAIKVNINF